MFTRQEKKKDGAKSDLSKINIYTNISYKIIRFYYIYRQIQYFLLFRMWSPIFTLLLFFKNHLVQITYVVISGTVMWTIRDVKIQHNISNHFCGISEHAKQIHRRQYAIEPQKANLSESYQTFKQSYLDRNIALVLFQYVQKNPGPVSSVAQ